MSTDQLLEQAQKADQNSPFDYIIVGSGAGGGPLAARLAEAGKRVLLLEAGEDPDKKTSHEFPDAEPGEVYRVPGYYTAASEDAEMSWQFSVRHYDDTTQQKKDEKYDRLNQEVEDAVDPTRPKVRYPLDDRFLDQDAKGGRKGGIFYPRAAALGGCTAHHAMIIVAPNDRDWNYIANLTGDESWRAEHMQGYFAKMEKCLYINQYKKWFEKVLGPLVRLGRWIATKFSPKASLDDGGHGNKGWQPTAFIAPKLIKRIAKTDRTFFRVLVDTTLKVTHEGLTPLHFLKRALKRFRLVRFLDPNDLNTRRTHPEGVFLIPTGIDNNECSERNGRRTGVREFLLETQRRDPDKLVILQGVHVTRVLFEMDGDTPKAIGVEYVEGAHLYEASPLQTTPQNPPKRVFARSSGEVVLCGGAFNTPQLLMLSGIGEEEKLSKIKSQNGTRAGLKGLCGQDGSPLKNGPKNFGFVNLPGVGRNLQDRYEVTVINELTESLSSLDDVSFAPGDPDDPERREWDADRGGIYATNGGTLAIIRRSEAAKKAKMKEPDLFTFGAPAAFRGYYWGYSRELFKPTIGAARDQKNLWSWVILKAYTSNDGGTVRLQSTDPFQQPSICFDSFNEAARSTGGPDAQRGLEDSQRDLDALVDAVKFMRKVNSSKPDTFGREIQPGPGIEDDSKELREWIRSQTWGHHASCTCRIGADPWRNDPKSLVDKNAVLDSKFRVHGVKGLRVVDASIFPKIPGYFIVTPIFMASEKAADSILADAKEAILAEAAEAIYPAAIERDEAEAVRNRRKLAETPEREPATAGKPEEEQNPDKPEEEHQDPAKLPADTVGLALSGGGIRSATFCLGLLQALAKKNRIRNLDFLSTVSGGGFIGSFLGRLFTRPIVSTPPPASGQPADPCGRVQEILNQNRSGPIWWLRTHANYLLDAGADDAKQNLASYMRNTLTIHLVVGALAFALFTLLALVGPKLPQIPLPAPQDWSWSPWLILPALISGLALLPAMLGYWLAPKSRSYRPYPSFALLSWLVLMTGAVLLFLLPNGLLLGGIAAGILVLTWIWQEVARWRPRGPSESELDKLRPVSGHWGATVRNTLTRALGSIITMLVLTLAWFFIDSLARSVASFGVAAALSAVTVLLAPLLPVVRKLAMGAFKPGGSGKKEKKLSGLNMAKLLAVPVLAFLVFVVDVLAHTVTQHSVSWALVAFGLALAFSLALGRAFEFLNRSSLQTAYSSRLIRTFLGASNEKRIYGKTSSAAANVQLTEPDDDTPFHQYHPEESGGPLHLVNVCINDTVDFASGRQVRDRKALSMCFGAKGVAVSTNYFAQWDKPGDMPFLHHVRRWFEGINAEDPKAQTALNPLPLPGDPDGFHPLGAKNDAPAPVEPLTLGKLVGISGAAFSTGVGRRTSTLLSILLGIANVRLGYWWDTGIYASQRKGRFPKNLWHALQHLPIEFFRMQSMLFSEWLGRFHGAARWFWYLSDGGHFENTAAYELIRRRLPLVIVADCGADPSYNWEDISRLMRQTRVDFGAEFDWFEPDKNAKDWDQDKKKRPYKVPTRVEDWVHYSALGSLDDINNKTRSKGRHAALARVTYGPQSTDETWLLVVKPSLSNDAPRDVRTYAASDGTFPQQPTIDQIFDNAQWESYRSLGQWIGGKVIKE